jgi:hypothetical protein
VLYQTPVLKLMNGLVFTDSFILIFIGVGMKGDQGIAFGTVYGLIGGLAAILMFNVAIVALIMLSSRNKRSQTKVKKPACHDSGVRAKI